MKRLCGIVSASLHSGMFWMLLLCFCFPMVASARQKTSFFRLTDSNAFLKLRTEFLETRIKSGDTETVVQTPFLLNEFGVSNRGFIYHPNLLEFDISGGMTLDKKDISRESRSSAGRIVTGSSDITRGFWDLDASLHFLREKRYPLRLFYSRQNPLVSTGLEGNFTQETESYGFNFSLIDILPVRLFLDARSTTSSGESLDRIVDNTYDRVTMKLLRDFSADDQIVLDYELTHQLSRNGNPSREILETDTVAHRSQLTSRFRFGGRDQFFFSESAAFNWRDDPEVLDVRLSPNFRWALTDQLESIFRYNYAWNDRPDDGLGSERHDASTEFRYRPFVNLTASAGVRGDKLNETQGVRQQSYGGFASGNYSHEFSFGRLSVIPTLDYTYRERESLAAQISIRDESLQMSATTPVALAGEFVIAGTVIVRNATRTQTFIEDVDYRLIEVGTQTEVQRLTGGNILEGETVIVDYDVKSGGAFDYSVLGQSLALNLNLMRYYNLYMRYRGSEQKVESGTSTLPLNSVRAVEVGGRADVPLRWRGLIVGGEAKYLYQDEDINPFDETTLLAYVQAPLPQRITLRISASHSIRNNIDSSDKSTTIMGNMNWRARRNLLVTARARHEEGTGRALDRSRTDGLLRASWRYRKLSLSGEARYEQETQGDSERRLLQVWLVIRRELW